MDEKKRDIIVAVLIMVTIVTTTGLVCIYHYNKWKILIEGGYTTEMLPGNSSPQWVKGK